MKIQKTMDYFARSCTVLGSFMLSFGLISLFIKERLYIAESVVATVYGIMVSPAVFGWIGEDFVKLLRNRELLFHLSHTILSLQLIAVGVTVPRVFLKKNWKTLSTLLLPAMVLTWSISSVIIKYVSGMNWLPAMIIGACVTPTDPILASAVVKGKFANKYIPWKLRHLLSVESGANDGLGFPLLTLALFLLVEKQGGEAVQKWLMRTWVFEILFAIVIGAAIGLAARLLLKSSLKQMLIDKESFLAYIMALAILVTGVTAMIGSDDLLAVFVSGLVFAWDEEMVKDLKNSHVLEVVDLLFNHTFFILFGAILHWESLKPIHFLAAGMVILFRRLPVIVLLKKMRLLDPLSLKETLFAGWFGPVGVGAIFFACHTEHFLHPYAEKSIVPEIFNYVFAVVLVSIFLHGTTAPIVHLHLRHRERRRKKEEDLEAVYCSDTECEKDEKGDTAPIATFKKTGIIA
jgi:NhaP-type Na+/H+ or K+/H+ antiporter